MHRIALLLVALCFGVLIETFSALAGPPFWTDDPEPVEYKNWEIYVASLYQDNRSGVSSTAPHFEANYGIAPDFQLHVIAPMEYAKPAGLPSHYGYGDTELGVKWRFFENEEAKFMAGIYPLVEIPTGDQSKSLGNGDPQAFLPLWLQKAWGQWLSYGGGGYWINPGEGHKDFWFLGWQVQREINKNLSLGVEIFYETPQETGSEHTLAFNAGAIINITANHHILMSAGTDISGPAKFLSYIAYQLTFGPEKEKGPSNSPSQMIDYIYATDRY
ncbi:conserved exported hypothetical protein [Syntrophobacter sp. SbD2]|nr:conserved exported hypothetical protein [Syntrophobacter sp. SbD2]